MTDKCIKVMMILLISSQSSSLTKKDSCQEIIAIDCNILTGRVSASNALYQLPLMESTFPPLIFLHCCLRRTCCDGICLD